MTEQHARCRTTTPCTYARPDRRVCLEILHATDELQADALCRGDLQEHAHGREEKAGRKFFEHHPGAFAVVGEGASSLESIQVHSDGSTLVAEHFSWRKSPHACGGVVVVKNAAVPSVHGQSPRDSRVRKRASGQNQRITRMDVQQPNLPRFRFTSLSS